MSPYGKLRLLSRPADGRAVLFPLWPIGKVRLSVGVRCGRSVGQRDHQCLCRVVVCDAFDFHLDHPICEAEAVDHSGCNSWTEEEPGPQVRGVGHHAARDAEGYTGHTGARAPQGADCKR